MPSALAILHDIQGSKPVIICVNEFSTYESGTTTLSVAPRRSRVTSPLEEVAKQKPGVATDALYRTSMMQSNTTAPWRRGQDPSLP